MKRMSLWRLAIPFVLTAIAAPVINAGPITEPYRVNLYTAGNQSLLDAATGANGDTILLWQDAGRGNFTYMQRYNSLGQPLQNDEWYLGAGATVAGIDGAGNFIIVRTAADGSGTGIYATIYDRSGNLVRSEFRINDTTANTQDSPAVAMNGRGEFVVAWTSYISGRPAVYAKRFRADGTAVASEALLSDPANGDQYAMDAAIDGAGNAVVTWYSQVPGTNNIEVWGRRFGGTGAPLAAAFRANTYITNVQIGNKVAMDTRGYFVIVWESYGQDGNEWGIYGQRYDNAGNKIGGEFQVNSVTTGSQQLADVAMTYDGGFVVVWQDDNRTNVPSSLPKVYVRQFSAAGMPLGAETSIDTTANNKSFAPRLGMDGSGVFTVGWQHVDASTNDMDVFARRYRVDYAPLVTSLFNGQTVANLVGAAGSWTYFKITVPPGVGTLDIRMTGAGDADLYLRYAALPTLGIFDARPWLWGSNESVTVQAPRAGDWYIGINGYSSFSNVSLSATYY